MQKPLCFFFGAALFVVLATSFFVSADSAAGAADSTRAQAQAECDAGHYTACAERWADTTRTTGSESDWLHMAEAWSWAMEPGKADQAYADAAARIPTANVYANWIRFLLNFRLNDKAAVTTETALKLFPGDPSLLESAAALAAVQGKDQKAAALIRSSWEHGADRLSWTSNAQLEEHRSTPPYVALLDPALLLSGIRQLDPVKQADRLQMLAAVMQKESAASVVDLVLSSDSSAIQRQGIYDLSLLGKSSVPFLAQLLQSGSAAVRRKVLVEARKLQLSEMIPVIQQYMGSEHYAGNFDFAQVVVALLQAGNATDARAAAAILEAIPGKNAYRYLALYRLAEIYAALGKQEEATSALRQASEARPVVQDSEGDAANLQAYRECKERMDIREILDILRHHRYVERIDARVYGLPENDFDDAQNLTIAERLFLRDWSKENGENWPTEGQMQYPREIRHMLESIYKDTGTAPDCSGFLEKIGQDPMARLLIEDGAELKLYEDTDVDNEVNIVVNPYDQRYVFATSNAYDPLQTWENESYRSSNWGNTWTHGTVTGGTNACDPVSYYNTSQMLYHSWLEYKGSIEADYSTDQGATWSSCASLENSGMDRQDLYIDTFTGDGGLWTPSPCLNKLYIGYHRSGAQIMKYSTGTSSPYCTTWSARVNLASPGTSGTIGTAITSSIGKNGGSGNGTVLYFFTRYNNPNAGLYYSLSTSCGAALGTPSLIKSLNTGLFEWGVPSACSRMTYVYPQADTDRQVLSAFRNNVYVIWDDLSSLPEPGCTGNTTSNSDIYLATGVPNNRDNPTAWTWSWVNLTANVIGTDNKTDEYYPSLSVDQADGSVYVSYYRSDSGTISLAARQKQVHYVMLRSTNAGASWSPVYQVTNSPTNEYDNGADPAMQWGDYTWLDTVNGVTYPCWTDRREAADEDIWASKVCSEPAHWSERAPTFTAPPTSTANAPAKVINVSWTAPDIYWGDGGENTSTRKYQLYVDSLLNQDNILWTSTSTSYTAGDCTTPHTFKIRAINQCAAFKDYATSTITASGCSSANPKEVSPSRNMTASKSGTTSISVGYTPACGATDNTVYMGTAPGLMTGTAWTQAYCNLLNTSPATFNPGDPAPGTLFYFVIAANNGTKEGTYGTDSLGAERPEANGLACDYTRDLTGTCP